MFACIFIPDFAVEAIVRTEPLLRERAVAVLEGKPPLARVIALNERARLLGVEAGMAKLQAAVFVEAAAGANRGTVLRPRSPEQENSAHSALLDIAHAFTPQVEDTASDTLLLDLVGLDRLYGSPAKMARELALRISAIGVEANIALAANPDSAMHAARGFSGITVIPAGEEALRLGVLPLQVLLDAFEIMPGKKASSGERAKQREQMLDTLERWGIRDFHSLALLPEHALASRLGEAGARLHRLARGAGIRTLVLCQPLAHFTEAIELESPVETLEPLAFVLNRLLEQLCARLEARALAAQELRLRLKLERRVADEQTTTMEELTGSKSHIVGEQCLEWTLCLPVAMRDSKTFLKLLQLELAAHPPGAPVAKIWITAEPAPPRSAQRGLFLPVTPEAERLEITLARIGGIVGERRAGIARLLDSHRRDSFRMDRFVAATEEETYTAVSDTKDQPLLAMRIFRPAWQLRVCLKEGRPVSLADRGALQGKIVWSAGPWRSSGDWWKERAKGKTNQLEAWDREEWDVALAKENSKSGELEDDSVGLYRIYRDLATGHWFADASYD